MKTTLTKHFLTDLKNSTNISIRFDDKFSTIDIEQENRTTTYAMGKNEYSHQSGFWYCYKSDFVAILEICKPGDQLTFVMYENGTEQLKTDGYRWIDLLVHVKRHSTKNPERILKSLQIKIDTMIAKTDSGNFKDLNLHINQSQV